MFPSPFFLVKPSPKVPEPFNFIVNRFSNSIGFFLAGSLAHSPPFGNLLMDSSVMMTKCRFPLESILFGPHEKFARMWLFPTPPPHYIFAPCVCQVFFTAFQKRLLLRKPFHITRTSLPLVISFKKPFPWTRFLKVAPPTLLNTFTHTTFSKLFFL